MAEYFSQLQVQISEFYHLCIPYAESASIWFVDEMGIIVEFCLQYKAIILVGIFIHVQLKIGSWIRNEMYVGNIVVIKNPDQIGEPTKYKIMAIDKQEEKAHLKLAREAKPSTWVAFEKLLAYRADGFNYVVTIACLATSITFGGLLVLATLVYQSVMDISQFTNYQVTPTTIVILAVCSALSNVVALVFSRPTEADYTG